MALWQGNNDWQDDPAQADLLSASGLAPENSLEAALLHLRPCVGQILLHPFVMPVSIIIDPEQRLVVTLGSGIVTDAELLRARQRLLDDPAFDPNYDSIWDFYAITEAQVTKEIVAELVASSPASDKPICRAVVMSKQAGPMKAIMNFLTLTRRASRRIAAFPDRASAERWVFTARHDLPPDLAVVPDEFPY